MTPRQEQIQALHEAARTAREQAYAPYSRYLVGAAVLGANGRIYAGCNVENAAYPVGTCAEAAALAAMVLDGEHQVVAALTVCEGEPVGTCCGGCRQRLREFAELSTPVYAADVAGVRATYTVGELLPDSFGPEHLAVGPATGDRS